jgi:hypothetical protein
MPKTGLVSNSSHSDNIENNRAKFFPTSLCEREEHASPLKKGGLRGISPAQMGSWVTDGS